MKVSKAKVNFLNMKIMPKVYVNVKMLHYFAVFGLILRSALYNLHI